jgi:hypothetical protein
MDRGRRTVTITLAVVAAALLAIAVQGGRWWNVGDVATIGPLSSHRCFDGDCRVVGLEWVGAGGGWIRIGIATYVAGLLAAALVLFTAAGIAARRQLTPRRRAIARSGLVAAITAAVAGGAFIALYPGFGDASLGRGAWCYLAGVVLAVAAQIVALRTPVAADPAAKT